MKRPDSLTIVVVVLGLSLGYAIYAYAGVLGRISVLTEQAETAEGVRDEALEGEQQARDSMDLAFEEADEERAESAVAIAEVRADLIVQEGVAETSFRRAEGLARDNPVLQQAIQEMRGDAIVASMKADSVIAVTAASLLTAQTRIMTLERLDGEKDEAHAMTVAAFQAEISIKDQIIQEQQNMIAPSFIFRLFDMPEVALFGAAVGGAIVYGVTR